MTTIAYENVWDNTLHEAAPHIANVLSELRPDWTLTWTVDTRSLALRIRGGEAGDVYVTGGNYTDLYLGTSPSDHDVYRFNMERDSWNPNGQPWTDCLPEAIITLATEGYLP